MSQQHERKTASGNVCASPRIAYLPALLGLAVMALGLFVMTGWLLQVRPMVEFRTGMVAMTFNTAPARS